MHAIKQVVGALATPMGLALIIAMLGWLARVLDRRRLSTGLFLLAVSGLYLTATPPVSSALLGSLERRYPSFAADPSQPVNYIVVLGSYYAPREEIPITAALGAEGLTRIAEGVRLARLFPDARLVVSGGEVAGYQASARGYAILARDLGVDASRLIIVDNPRDTAEEAAAIVKLLGATPFALVTSASHMPRAMRLMTNAGGRPLAVPTGHRADTSRAWSWRWLVPSASALRGSEMAFHEYLGLLALSMGMK